MTFDKPHPNCVAAVLDTESRHVCPEQAFSRVKGSVASEAWDLIYKKTDSTLRGNLAAEFDALPGEIVFIPAYPAMGRTVRDGMLYVNRKLLHTTAFARDPLNPISNSSVAHALRECRAKVRVFDSESEEQVAGLIAEALKTHSLLAGPANLAGHLAAALDVPRSSPEKFPPLGKVLVVNGSLHPASAAQFEFGRVQGWPDWTFASVFEPGAYDSLIVFGGDTAFNVVTRLGISEMWPLGEAVAGVPVSRAGGLQLITKAGGFGPVDVLGRLRQSLA